MSKPRQNLGKTSANLGNAVPDYPRSADLYKHIELCSRTSDLVKEQARKLLSQNAQDALAAGAEQLRLGKRQQQGSRAAGHVRRLAHLPDPTDAEVHAETLKAIQVLNTMRAAQALHPA